MEKPHPENVVHRQESKTTPEMTRAERVAKILELVEKINESGETLPFPGIHPDAYVKMKQTDTDYPGYTTPTDEIIERCTAEGIKIVFGDDPNSGNVFVLPADSDNIGMDSIAPHQLAIELVTNEHLRELIQITTKKVLKS